MTVQEWFEGDKVMRADIADMIGESDYNDKAANFILEKWETDADDLTVNQSAWACRILDDMVERRINRSRRARY